jgi:hypothetical protein
VLLCCCSGTQVPLYDLASINLNPQVYIKVDVDSEHRKVHFNADRCVRGKLPTPVQGVAAHVLLEEVDCTTQ